ncbi:AzlC family ABC transporter permease [Pseudooceanicola nitratireducens]|jgi:predicted branched-subunit amino acid permease|uniref:AzlC family ABC transporter permease n=1 Tax=Pseudooceanicola nitratireducens TaxID=517719 RepID=UPI001C95358D|nr:AzlC family ABC transporter permease [Pseudooceanicola nitratireducens]MBY6157910.1 AzlC family ABC transporter permease [Pseudooceanicola nitratireducens]MBY6164712.1 AzlC family ABC transporter permease [Pseudooceanicola nitratireducens]MEC7298633.1 AzlC family ABC transporter permease [Pseudomonadota bacterium]
MSSTISKCFWRGFRDGLPFLLVVGPFSVLFGVVAAEAGLNVIEALSFSVVVIAGAAQFTAVQLLQDDAPTVIIILSALAINLRMAMYSATLTPHLGKAPLWQRAFVAYFLVDQSFALSAAKYEKERGWSTAQKIAYFFGTVTPICPMWYVLTVVGALIGNAIPPEYALDFALPITFLAMIAPMLRSLPHLAAAAVAVTASLVFSGLPLNLGLLVAGVLGMMTGARVELWTTAKQKEALA